MSSRKDGVKTSTNPSVPKKKIATTSKVSSRKRDDSTDRVAVKKTEMPVKSSSRTTTNVVKDKTLNVSKTTSKSTIRTSNVKSDNSKQIKSSNRNPPIAKKVTGLSKTSSSRISKSDIPSTPTSSRVTRTQFFPSKSMYSQALKTNEKLVKNINTIDVKINKTEPKKTKVIGKSTIKKPLENESSDNSSISERPRTATLRKGSIVNANIVGPDAPKLKKSKEPPITKLEEPIKERESPKSNKSDENNYEDDFDSYDSDFEAYSSSSSTNLDISGEGETSSISSTSRPNSIPPEETRPTEKRVSSAGTDDERKMDSGHFDMPDFKHKQLLENIKESIEKENAMMTEQSHNNPASLSDEGFEEAKSLQLINFLGAQRKFEHRKSVDLRRKRGEEILSMIRLDTYNFTLLNLEPVPYETFIKRYGKTNSVQTSIQTGEDDVNEEIQTDTINLSTKWTQCPVMFSKVDESDSHFWSIYKQDFLGVGSDDLGNYKSEITTNENDFNKFILSAGDLVLNILNENSKNMLNNFNNNTRDIPFSSGYIQLNTAADIFRDTTLKCASFSPENSKKFVTVHIKNETDNFKSVISVWDLSSSSEDPKISLRSFSEITCCIFGFASCNFIYAGSNDGTILVWNLKHLQANLINCPSFVTDIDSGHNSRIVAIQPIVDTLDRILHFDVDETKQICSLDEDGELILWNIFVKEGIQKNEVMLIKNFTFSLRALHPDFTDLQCNDFIVDNKTITNLYISTNYGYIIKHPINGVKSNLQKFPPDSESEATCLELCPFSSDYFLSGFSNGNINIYSSFTERPLIALSNTEDDFSKANIQFVQWSRHKPFVLYTKDASNSIHIWDLSQSDIYPVYSIPFNESITCMKLSPFVKTNEGKSTEKSFMLLGTEDGSIFLHLLNLDYGQQITEKYDKDIKTFLNYVNRL